jgi:hypothetical protein
MRSNLKAFLSTARGIPDYILEDYNNNFGFDIPLTDDSGQRQNILNPSHSGGKRRVKTIRRL